MYILKCIYPNTGTHIHTHIHTYVQLGFALSYLEGGVRGGTAGLLHLVEFLGGAGQGPDSGRAGRGANVRHAHVHSRGRAGEKI